MEKNGRQITAIILWESEQWFIQKVYLSKIQEHKFLEGTTLFKSSRVQTIKKITGSWNGRNFCEIYSKVDIMFSRTSKNTAINSITNAQIQDHLGIHMNH